MGGGRLTDDQQRVPLPLPGATGAVDGMADLGVGLSDVVGDSLGVVVDLLDGRLLLVHQLGDFLVQPTQLRHVLLDLADGGRSLHGGLAGVVGLAGSASGDLGG